MSKDKISDYSSTANSNTDIASINIDEGCAPSGINNAIRAVMGHLKDFQTGASGDPVTVGGVLTVTGGSASAPAITTAGDTNTGVAFPAADTVAIATGGTERVRVDSSGNVGIGTSSPQKRLQVVGTDGAVASFPTIGGKDFFILENNGNANISLIAAASSASELKFFRSGASTQNGSLAYNHATDAMTFVTASAERMRIDSSGNLLVGTTSFGGGSTIGFQINATNNTSGAYAQLIKNSSGTEIFQMRCNGGLANFSANNVNLSDERTKTEIQDAGSYLSKICAIPVRTFKYKDQTDDLLNLGCIAQEVEAVAPELVDVTGFGETPEDGVPLKAIYQTDLQYALMKCIQEQQALITSLTERITALEGATQ